MNAEQWRNPMQRWILVCGGLVVIILVSWSIQIRSNTLPVVPQAKSITFNNPSGRSITITPWGPDQAAVDAAIARTGVHSAVQRYLRSTKNRVLGFEYIDDDTKSAGRSLPPTRYRVIFFDYTNNRSVVATGSFLSGQVEASTSKDQPNPSPDEFQAAVEVIRKDPALGPALRSSELVPYEPMPPVAVDTLGERMVTVGLMQRNHQSNEVVAVNMFRETVRRFKKGAPLSSDAADLFCGYPSAGQGSTPSGTAGQYEVVISRGGAEIWRFIVLRPSISSGNNKSAIELRDVDFRGKRVLARANAPVLNVEYERNSCGPFRDWSWQEGMFEADGVDIPGSGPNGGFRMCTAKPQTVLENGTDVGNFRGVAMYDREEVTLVSELNAGWYRYPSMWVFHDDGIIEPRFGFGATQNSCVCRPHTHHVYWRFDFDIVTAANNSILETGLTVQPQEHSTEVMRYRQLGPKQNWVIQGAGGESCVIIPGARDGDADKYGRGDVWLLRSQTSLPYPSNQIDDSGTGEFGSQVHIGAFLNGESIASQDIVVWYGGHFEHKQFDDDGPAHSDTGQSVRPAHSDGPFWIGPRLVLRKY
jgi:hypothetical protein